MQKSFTPFKAGLGFLGVLAVAAALSRLDGWGDPASNESAIGEVSRWCERVGSGLLREPVNTLGRRDAVHPAEQLHRLRPERGVVLVTAVAGHGQAAVASCV